MTKDLPGIKALTSSLAGHEGFPLSQVGFSVSTSAN